MGPEKSSQPGTASTKAVRKSAGTLKSKSGARASTVASGDGKPQKRKFVKRSAKKASASRKPAKKLVKTLNGAAVAAKGGRPMLFPDRTICRLPKGSLKALGAKAKRLKISQGEAVRVAIATYLKAA